LACHLVRAEIPEAAHARKESVGAMENHLERNFHGAYAKVGCQAHRRLAACVTTTNVAPA